ncbi:hypothetical protein, partial [Psychrobacter namhaensis]|uniref:hypothetical protein n=2 Tax=Psychrobacter namhaensis TaxID=292734 RepID=UPI001D02DAB3
MWPLACEDLAERIIKVTRTLLDFSYRTNAHIRYERMVRLATKLSTPKTPSTHLEGVFLLHKLYRHIVNTPFLTQHHRRII